MNTDKFRIKERTCDIIGGPGKDLLFDACKYAYSDTVKIEIEFMIVGGYTMPTNDPGCAIVPLKAKDFRIIEIGHEDGSGESFNLRGYCYAILTSSNKDYIPCKFSSYYNAKKRKGFIRLLSV